MTQVMENISLEQSVAERRLRYIYRIDKHPVSQMPQSIIEKYLCGLGAALFDIAEGNAYMRILFEQWAISISGENHSSSYKSDKAAIKTALSLFRVKWKLLRLKYEFFFDCYYLTEKYKTSQLKKLAIYFQDTIPYFAKKALKDVDSVFLSKTECKKIPQSLIKHRLANNNWTNRKPKKLLVVANMSAGKSTLINALIGYRLNRVKTTVCTSRICNVYNNKYNVEGIFTYDTTKRQYTYLSEIESTSSDHFTEAGLHYNSLVGNGDLCIIDTPGFNNVDHPEHRKTTEKVIQSNDYDGILYVANAQYMGTSDEAILLEFIQQNSQKPIVFAINQLDRMKPSEDSIDRMLKDFKNHLKKLKFNNPTVAPISAKAALFFKLGKAQLDEDDCIDYESLAKKFNKNFYDFQQISGDSKSTSLLEATGINHLEKIINQIFKL